MVDNKATVPPNLLRAKETGATVMVSSRLAILVVMVPVVTVPSLSVKVIPILLFHAIGLDGSQEPERPSNTFPLS